MLKFLRTFALAAAMMLPFAMQAQQSWTVADGTTVHAKVPLDFYNCDGSGNRQAQMLYPSTLLTEMDGSTIGTITFYHQNTTATKTVSASTWYIRMGETTETDLSSGLSTETLTTVYSGVLQVTNGVFSFELTTPYTYNGGNLIVEIQTSGASGNYFGSYNQGCFGMDNIGSTYSTMSTPNHTAFLPKTTFTELPSCFPVTNLAIDATQTTTSSLTLTWTDTRNSGASYDVYLVTPTDTTSLDNTTTTSYTATGLDANTTYVLGVVSNCGGGDMAQMVTVSGRTACAAIATLPYTMGFEDADLQGTTSALLFPFCWTRINTSTSTSYNYYPYAYSSTSAHNGGRHLYFYASSYGSYADTTGFVMPELDVTTYPMNGNRVTFWAKASSSSYPFTVLVGTMTDPTDRSTFTLAESVNVAATSYTKYTVSLASATATDAYVAFIVPKVGSTMYIDDVTLEELPSCGDVTGLTVAGTTSSTATLLWNTVDGAMGYTVYNMADNSVLGTATDTTYTVEDLDANTVYTFGVQSNCAGGDGAIATASGRTACGAVAMPWTENFASSLASDPCWRGASNITADSAFNGGVLTLGTFNTWSHVTSPRCGLEGGHYYKNVYGSSVKHWMITPAIDLTTATSAQLSFDVALTDYNNATLPEENADTNTSQVLMVIVSTDGGATWQRSNATVWQNVEGANYTYASLASTTYQTKVINLDQYLGQTINIAFYCQSLWAGGDNDLHLDNIAVTEVPDCPAPANIVVSNLTGHTATLTWEGNADGYTVYDMSDTSVYQYANDTTIELYALSGETAYTFGVTSNCGSDESEMATISFTTPISCPVPTNLAAALTPGNGTVATLSWHEAGEAAEWQICIDGDMENLIDVNDTTYDMTGLTPEQAVTAKVRAICGADDTSAWSSTITFTPTDAFSVTVNDGTTTNDYVPIYGLYVDNNIHSQFIIPAADLSAMQWGIVNKLTFYASNANVPWTNASFEVYLTETEATGVSSLNAVSDMTQVYTGSLSIVNNKMEVTLATPYTYMGGNLLVAFEQPTSGSYASSSWYGVSATGASMGGYGTSVSQKNFLPKMTIDYIPGEEPSCFPVSGLAASDISTDEATLSWTGDAGSYNVYSISGADTTFVQNVSDATITLTGLDAMTQYTYGVRAACGSDESDIRTVVFNTACGAVSLPYTETFAATSATRNCWNLVSNNTANVGGNNGMGFVTTTEGREVLQFSSYSRDNAGNYDQYGFSPLMNVSDDATNLQVTVVYGTNTDDNLYFGYITANDTVWDPTPYNTGSSAYSTTFNWQSQTFVIPATAIQLAVHYYGDYSYYGRIDSVTVTEMTGAYCAPVTDLAATDATETSITLVWTGDAASYTVMNDTTVVATGITDTTYTVTGLTSSTTYTFSVIANCSATENSDPRSVTANTSCGTFTLPYAETFDATSASRNCWSTLDADHDGYNWSTRSLDEDTYVYTEANMMISESFNEDGALTPDNWLISPKIQTVAADTIKLGWTVYSFGNASYAAEHYAAYVSTTTADTNAFTSLGEWTLSANDNAGTRVNIDLSAYAGQEIYIAFRHFNCTDMYYMGIDSVTVTAINGSTPQPQVEEATIAASAVTYWVGTGSNQVVMAVNWADTALAWGVNFSTDSITSQDVLDIIAANDPRFSWDTGSYGLSNITFTENGTTHTGDATHFWESKRNTISDRGLYQNLGNGDFQKWANSAAGVVVDSMEYSGAWYYMYNYPMTIYPVTAPQPGPQPADSIVVTYATNNAALGTTNPAPGTYTYQAGDTVFFNAIPTTGNSFVAWIIDYSDGTADTVGAQYQSGYYFLASSMMGDGITSMTFTAYFQAGVPTPDSVAVTYTVNDATMGSINPNGVVMTAVGDTVAAVATANAGFELYGWGYVVTYNGSNIQDTIFETTVTAAAFLIVPQVYADNGVTITITAMFRQHEGINDVTANMNIYSTDNKIIVKGAEGEDIYIYDLNGRTVATKANANETMEFTMANSGVYMVKVGNAPAKRVLVIR